MKIFNVIVILFLILFIFLVYMIISNSASVDNKKVNPDVPDNCTGSGCKTECSVRPGTIKRCTMNEDGTSICSNCRCDSTGKLSGCLECKESDPNDPSKTYAISDVSKEQCKDPFFWDEKESRCKLGPGSFCLPPEVVDIPCNKYTGRKLLSLDTRTNTYKWTCVCIDNKFSGTTCSDINVCGMEGSSDNPNKDGRGLYKKGTNEYWNINSKWDPNVDGKCKCGNNEQPNDSYLSCMPNDCSPAGKQSQTDSESCICTSKGYVDCKTISQTFDSLVGGIYDGVCKRPSCVPDPCAGIGPEKDAGIYQLITDPKDPTVAIGSQCVCNEKEGYYLVPDQYAFRGWTCQKVCENNGPCGNRGKCNYSLEQTLDEFSVICTNNTTGQCDEPYTFVIKYDVKNNSYFLNYDINTKKLTFRNSLNDGSKFKFLLRKCKDNKEDNCSTVSVQQGLSSGNDYYILLENVTGKNYLSFKEDINGDYNLMGENDTNINDSLFNFSNTNKDKRPSAINKGFILFKNFNKYLGVIKGEPPLILLKNKKNPGIYCGDYDSNKDTYTCNPGYTQDDQLLCLNKCTNTGEWVNVPENPDNVDVKLYCCSGKKQDQESKKECIKSRYNPNTGTIDCIAYQQINRIKCG